MPHTEILLVLCSCPDDTVAAGLARTLVEEHLAACVNRLAGMRSTYRWHGQICDDTECLLLIKTTRDRFEALRERIVALHPYELPEVIAVDIVIGAKAYLEWVGMQTQIQAD